MPSTSPAAEPVVLEPIEPSPASDGAPQLVDSAESPVVFELVSPDVPEERPGFVRRLGRGIASVAGWCFGSISLIVALAFIASVPIVQFLALGYLLEAAGRIGRTGRFRDAFPGVRLASRLGGIVLGTWLVTLPWRYSRVLLIDAELIDPDSPQTLFVRRLLVVLAVLTPLQIVLALSRGGRLRYFFAPLNIVWFVRRMRHGGYFRKAWTSRVAMLRELRVWHYFSLGLRGYLGALAWLIVPSTLYAIGTSEKTALLGILGGLMMTIVVLYVPFLQVHFAVENRFRAMFQIGEVRKRFRHSPIAFFISFLFALVLVLPLYLLKIEVVPRDAMWLPALVFIVTIFPLKVMTGWAYGRSLRREAAGRRAWFITRLGCRLLMLPVAFFYAFFVFFTQYTGWHGVQGLYEHHAFLLPVPF
jgi:hypothetical protein